MEILLELFLPFIAEFLIDVIVHLFPERSHDRNVAFAIVGYALVGAVAGAFSLFALPEHLIRSRSLQIANLVITPAIVAAVMAMIGAARRKREKRVVRMERFVYAYATALTFAMVRFFGAS